LLGEKKKYSKNPNRVKMIQKMFSSKKAQYVTPKVVKNNLTPPPQKKFCVGKSRGLSRCNLTKVMPEFLQGFTKKLYFQFFSLPNLYAVK